MNNFQLHRNAMGKLVYTAANGETHEGVAPVHAFPISAPTEAIALVNAEGHELEWINRLSELPAEIGSLLEEEFASSEFMPEISRLVQVSSFAMPSTWSVETDRGTTSLVLKSEDDIRRLSGHTLLIADSHGIHFLIRDLNKLDHTSRRLLDRFL